MRFMITVDAMGDACPIPVIKTKKALAELNGSGELEVFVDNEIAVQNVSKMAANASGDVTVSYTHLDVYKRQAFSLAHVTIPLEASTWVTCAPAAAAARVAPPV